MILPDSTIIIQLLIFLATAFLLGRLLFIPMVALFAEREKRTLGAHKDAESLKEKADSLMARYDAEIEKARKEALGEKEKIVKEAADQARVFLEESREESQRIIDGVKAGVEQEMVSARERLRAETSGLARGMASRLLGRALSVVVCVLLFSGTVWAEEAGHHTPTAFFSLNLLWSAINFGIFLWILVRYLKRPLKDFLLERKASIASSIEEADRKKAEEEGRLRGISEKLAQLSEEVAGIHTALRTDGEAERQKLLEEAKAMSERIREEMREVSDAEVVKARRALREEAATLTARLTEEILKEKFTDQDQSRLVEEYLSRLKSTPV